MKKTMMALLAIFMVNTVLAEPVLMKVQSKRLQSSIQYDGHLLSANILELQSPVNATLFKTHVKLGDNVKPGQLLFELSSPELQAQLADASIAIIEKQAEFDKLQAWSNSFDMLQAQANVNKAKHELARTESRFIQTQKLYQHGIVAKEECLSDQRMFKDSLANYQNAKRQLAHVEERANPTALSLAKLQLEQAQNKAALLQQKMTALKVLAPFMGTLIAPQRAESAKPFLGLYPQRVFQEREVIAWLADMSELWISVTVDELDIVRLQQGQAAKVVFAAFPAIPLTGKIVDIANQHVQAKDSRKAMSYEVKIALNAIPAEVQGKLLMGMTAAVQIEEVLPEGLWIEKIAIQYENNEPYVNKRLNQAWVKQQVVLADNAKNEIRVVKGLVVGDEILLHG